MAGHFSLGEANLVLLSGIIVSRKFARQITRGVIIISHNIGGGGAVLLVVHAASARLTRGGRGMYWNEGRRWSTR